MSLRISNWGGRIELNSNDSVPPNSILVVYYSASSPSTIQPGNKIVFGPGITGGTIHNKVKVGCIILNALLVQFD